jgi:pyruvate dehydrogenase E2 component (dihydrolipoamide acetyltransferase)
MQEGSFVAWRVQVGASVAEGDEIADMETEKVVNALEAPADGILRRCIAEEGDTLAVGSLVGVLSEAGVSDAEIDAFIAGFVPADVSVGGGGTPAATGQATPEAPAGEIRASLAARRLAEKLGIDLATVPGSGRKGRITPQDVEQAAESFSADGEFSAAAMSSMRKTIARRLVESKRNIPHYYLTAEIAVDALLKHRDKLAAEDVEVSITDLIVRATALTLMDVPEVNAHLVGAEIRHFPHAAVAVAVATDNGLVAPVVHAAEKLSLPNLAQILRELAENARAGRLQRGNLEGGTFTVSNLGMFDIKQFTAIINPPQVAILAVGAVQARVIFEAGQAKTINQMTVTLSCDHRVVDGVVGARFLQALRKHIESPEHL